MTIGKKSPKIFYYSPKNTSDMYLSNTCTINSFFYINLFIYLFIFGCVGSLLLRVGFSPVAASGSCSLFLVCRLHIAVASRCGARTLGVWASVVAACGSAVVVHGL